MASTSEQEADPSEAVKHVESTIKFADMQIPPPPKMVKTVRIDPIESTRMRTTNIWEEKNVTNKSKPVEVAQNPLVQIKTLQPNSPI